MSRRQNSLRERQLISLSVPYAPEVQTVMLRDTTGGTYYMQQPYYREGQVYYGVSRAIAWDENPTEALRMMMSGVEADIQARLSHWQMLRSES